MRGLGLLGCDQRQPITTTGTAPRPVIPETGGWMGHLGAPPCAVEHHVCHKPNWQMPAVQQLRRS